MNVYLLGRDIVRISGIELIVPLLQDVKGAEPKHNDFIGLLNNWQKTANIYYL